MTGCLQKPDHSGEIEHSINEIKTICSQNTDTVKAPVQPVGTPEPAPKKTPVSNNDTKPTSSDNTAENPPPPPVKAKTKYLLGSNEGVEILETGYMFGISVIKDGNTICEDPYYWEATNEIECD